MRRANLSGVASVDDLRSLAQRRLPRILFDFLDGAAGDERTAAANRQGLNSIALRQRVLAQNGHLDTRTVVPGGLLQLPFMLAPMAFAGLFHRDRERGSTIAAAGAGIGHCLALASIDSLETVRAASPDALLYLQLYKLRDRGILLDIIERARAARVAALVLTVDVPVHGRRYRDMRNGFYQLPRITARTLADFIGHLPWLASTMAGGRLSFGNIAAYTTDASADFFLRQVDPDLNWDDLEWIRAHWNGPVIVKGIMAPIDALRAADEGVQGLVISNHGGRQLEGSLASVDALAEVKQVVGERVFLFVDSGIRRGADLVRMLALGAGACLVGRPWGYGLAAAGIAGVAHAIDLLGQELLTTMRLQGLNRTTQCRQAVVSRYRPGAIVRTALSRSPAPSSWHAVAD
jgi:L-lactate dehydrogenase (cytochrome)